MKFEVNLTQAIIDYKWLLEKEYPQKRTLDLVTDRYGLSQSEKAILYRGVTVEKQLILRKQKRFNEKIPCKHSVKIDTFNQLYTIASYLDGSLVFISADGWIKDASEQHGNSMDPTLLQKSVDLIRTYFENNPVEKIEFYIDKQVNDHQVIKTMLVMAFSSYGNNSEIIISEQVDNDLMVPSESIIATSDSQIITKTKSQVCDLAFTVLNEKFTLNIPDISLILSEMI